MQFAQLLHCTMSSFAQCTLRLWTLCTLHHPHHTCARAHCKLHTAYDTLYHVHISECTLCTLHMALHTKYETLCTLGTLISAHRKSYTLHTACYTLH